MHLSIIRNIICLSCLCLLVHSGLQAQQLARDSVLELKMRNFYRTHPKGLLFAHTDKTLYTNNETIWFSAYLIRMEEAGLEQHDFISAVLAREDSREVYLQQKYIMANGIANGSMLLPDSIPPGDYMLMLYTNVLDKNNQPVASFTQPVTIRSITQRNFSASIQLMDSTAGNAGVRARVVVYPKVSELEKKVRTTVSYKVGKLPVENAKLTANSSIITISNAWLQQSKPVLYATVKYGKETQYLSLPLPEVKIKQPLIRFYPEGGHLADGLETLVGWECRTADNFPVSMKAILFRDDKAIDSIYTSSTGMGSFRLKPDGRSRYTIRPVSAENIRADSVWELPRPIENGIAISLPEAAVNDSLRFIVFSKQTTQLHVLVHNFREIFYSFGVTAKREGTKVMVLLPQDLPKGVAAITVLDEERRPLAERLFFPNYHQQVTAGIQTNKKEFEQREKVTVQLRIKDGEGKPVAALLSMAVVQDSRIEFSKQQDIASHGYLTSLLGNLQKPITGTIFRNKKHLEDILLIKGWRRFTWPMVNSISEKDTGIQLSSPAIYAHITYNNKPPRKPVTLSVFKSDEVQLPVTDQEGYIRFSSQMLHVQEGKKIFLLIAGTSSDGHVLKVTDPYISMNKQLAEEVDIIPRNFRPASLSSREQELQGSQQSKMLQAVVVTHNKQLELYGRGANACGDYVCSYDILNCPRHFGDPFNRPPFEGRLYTDARSGIRLIYVGCTIKDTRSQLEGILQAREFYGVNMEPDAVEEKQYLSTLFWQPADTVPLSGEKEYSFYTGDITGRFRIIVQGVGVNGLIYAESFFSVK